MTMPKDARERLAAVMDALAFEAEKATDEDLLEEAAADGLDAGAESNRVRGLLFAGVVRAKKAEVANALAGRPKTPRAFASGSRIPRAPAERRALLLQTLGRRPHVKDALAPQRDFATLSDSDVERVLEELDSLGLLRDDDSDEKP
jgi:hypothetical protein